MLQKFLKYLPIAFWAFLVGLASCYLIQDHTQGKPVDPMGVVMLFLLLGIGAFVVWYGKRQQ